MYAGYTAPHGAAYYWMGEMWRIDVVRTCSLEIIDPGTREQVLLRIHASCILDKLSTLQSMCRERIRHTQMTRHDGQADGNPEKNRQTSVHPWQRQAALTGTFDASGEMIELEY